MFEQKTDSDYLFFFSSISVKLWYSIKGKGGDQIYLKNLKTLQKWFEKIFNRNMRYSSDKLYSECGKTYFGQLFCFDTFIKLLIIIISTYSKTFIIKGIKIK